MRRALRDAVVRLAESPRGTPPASPVDACLEPILELASGAYERWCNVRRQLYASGALPIGRVDAPVISVGNVTWGGCGKTPMAEWVARECAAFGAAPAVLSRGYRGGDEAWMLRRRLGDVRGARVMVGADRLRLARDALGGSTARVGASWRADGRAWDGTGSGTSGRGLGAGLNAFAYETKFAGDVDVDDVELRCAEDQWRGGSRGRGGGHRVGGGHGAEAASAPGRITAVEDPSDVNGPRGASIVNIRRHGGGSDAQTPSDVFVLDDGMQHLRLARDLEVVMVNALAKWGNGRLVPRGPLREHPSLALRRADVVALHHHRPIGTNRVHPRGGGAEDEGEDDAGAFEREVRSHMSPGALLVKTRMRPVRIERLARYLSPAHEWTLPLSRLRGAKVLCLCGVGCPAALEATLVDLVAPATKDDANGYGLRLRNTGSVEVWNLGDHEAFRESDIEAAVARFREMHLASGEVGGAEARLVLTEKDVGRLVAGGPERMHRALAVLARADPLVLCAELEVTDPGERDALSERIAATLGAWSGARVARQR